MNRTTDMFIDHFFISTQKRFLPTLDENRYPISFSTKVLLCAAIMSQSMKNALLLHMELACTARMLRASFEI